MSQKEVSNRTSYLSHDARVWIFKITVLKSCFYSAVSRSQTVTGLSPGFVCVCQQALELVD